MDILSLRLFLRIAEIGVVSSAAADLSLSPAGASARLARLEETLGFQLFHRTTRAVSLSTDGEAFLPYAQQVLESLDMGLSAVRGQGLEARGLLRMTMPGSFARMHILPALAAFKTQHPAVQLDLRLSDEVLDVVEGAYDLIIRNAPLTESSMIARKLAPDHRLLVAAPAYLAERGTPQSLEDLKDHHFVSFPDTHRLKFEDGQTLTIKPTTIVNDGEAMRSLIEAGFGIGQKSVWNGYQSLRAGKLVPVLKDHPLVTDSAIWALYPRTRIVSPKVRAMIDFLQTLFTPKLPWAELKP